MKFQSRLPYRSFLMLSSAVMLVTASGCQLAENYTKADRSGNMEIQDYRDALAPREVPKTATVSQDKSIPSLQPYVSDDISSASRGPMPMVSIAINQSIPLRDALFELAKQADYDIQLDPRIAGSIIYTARNRPFDEVIDQISNIAGLRSNFVGNSVKIEIDTPYSQTYRMDFLPFTRKTQSSVNTSLSVSGSGGDGGGSSTDSGSTFSIETNAEADFWKDLESNIKQIVDANQKSGILKTSSDPSLSLSSSADTATNPPVPPIDPAALAPQAGDETISFKNVFTGGQLVQSDPPASTTTTTTTGGTAPATAPAAPTTANGGTSATAAPSTPTTPAPSTPAPSETVLQVESLPTSSAEAQEDIVSTFSINKTAGILTVFAPASVQKKVADYLSQIKSAVSQQVLIEAKVLEVQLNDEYSNGIDWSIVSKSLGGIDLINFNSDRGITDTASSSIRIDGAGVTAVIDMISRFGTVKALASPRVTVLNNQSAVLNVAENRVFFEFDVEREDGQDGEPDTITIDSESRTVPEGVLINVMPSIDTANGMVTMQVRPTISRIVDEVNDPSVALTLAQAGITDSSIQNLVPVVSVKEIDTVVRMESGEAVVMGGLMEDDTTGTQRGVPVANEVPILGNLFKTQDNSVRKSEFVIFLQATILNNPSDSVHNTDKDIYRTFGQDRRPFKM
jgi:MSHA biogenesis protein MshL